MIMKKRWKHIIDFLHDYINKARTKTWTNNSCSTSLPHQSRSKRRVKNHSLYIQRSTTDPLHSLTEPYIMFSHCGHGIPCHNTTSWAVLPTEHRPTDNRNDDDHESTTDDTVNTGVHYCLVGPINHLTNREEFVITSSTVIQRYSFTSISRLSTRVRFIADIALCASSADPKRTSPQPWDFPFSILISAYFTSAHVLNLSLRVCHVKVHGSCSREKVHNTMQNQNDYNCASSGCCFIPLN